MVTKRCVLAGGRGFLGSALAGDLLRKNYEVVVLTRSPENHRGTPRQIYWDGKTLDKWITSLDGAEAIVNLTGKSVICRYTPENRQEILSSRIDSVRVIGEAIESCKHPPKTWVQCGSLAIYGDAGEKICDETAAFGEGFSANTCVEWEQALNSIETPATRKVMLRIGFVLAKKKGALRTLANLARYFLGGTVGSGRQYISWIGTEDLNRMFLWAIEKSDFEGVFNATSPLPVTNSEFMHELRRAVNRPWSPRVPEWAVKLGSKLMGIEPELALTGRRCLPKRFQEKGFEFKQNDLRAALQELFAV